MALTPEQKKKLAKLSIESEGLSFVGKSIKATPVPTIVISLGGLGCETLNILKKKVVKNLGNPQIIRFLAIDSDEDDLRDVKKSRSKDGWLEDAETVSLFDPNIAELLLYHGKNRPPFTYEWMRKDFPEIRIENNGAQGNRQTGRVMVTCGAAYHTIKAKLAGMVKEASDAAEDNQNGFEIILIAGVSGGTGSGTIIDISYLVHRVMQEANITTYNFSAYIYTPDVQFSVVGIRNKEAIMNNLKRNGYAALKEIDYFMNLENHHGVYSINPGGEGVWESRRNIFTACTIVSGILASGMNTKMDTMQSLTENLLDILSDIELTGQGDGGNPQMSSSFSSNKRENVTSWYNSTGRDPMQYPKEATYTYQMLGYSAVSIPKDEILAYCINKMFQAVYGEFKQIEKVDGELVRTILSRASVDDVTTLAEYALSLQSANPVEMNITLMPNEYPTKNDVKNGTDMTYAMCTQYAQFEANKISDAAFKTKLKSEIFNKITEQINDVFDKNGPYFVVELLTHTLDKVMETNDPRDPFAGIIESLRSLATQCLDLENEQQSIANSMNTQAQVNSLRAAATGLLAGKDKMKQYVDFNGQVAVSAVINTTLYHTLQDVIKDVITELVTVNNGIWEVYTDVLTEISGILETDAQAITSSEKHATTYTYDVLNLYEVSAKSEKLRKYLENFVSPKAVDDLSRTFIKSMRDKREEWTALNNAENFDVVTEVRAIFDQLMKGVLGTDIIEKFVVAAYSPNQLTPEDVDRIWANDGHEKEVALKAAAKEIYNILNNKGTLMAKLDVGYTQSNFLDKKLVVTIEDTPQLSQELSALYGANAGAYEQAKSKGLSKYIFSTIIHNVPLYLFDGMQEYDKVYRDTISSIGLHMDEVSIDFRRFPQPFVIDIAAKKGLDYEDFRDYEILMDVKKKADRAIEEFGFIEKSDWQGCYVMYNATKVPDNLDALERNISGMIEVNGEDTSLKEAMETSGYRFEIVNLTMAYNALDPLDRAGTGRYVEVGDFYKLLRMSIRYIILLDKNLKVWDEAKAVYERVMDDYQTRAQYQRNLNTFVNALKAGFVKDEGKGVWSYTSRGNRDVLVDLRTETPFDRDHALYHAFYNFCKLKPEIISDFRQSARKAITGDEDVSLLQDMVEEILSGDDYLGGLFAKDYVKEDAKASDLDYTFTDHLEFAKDPYKVLKGFYNSLKSKIR